VHAITDEKEKRKKKSRVIIKTAGSVKQRISGRAIREKTPPKAKHEKEKAKNRESSYGRQFEMHGWSRRFFHIPTIQQDAQ
jgi:hypothetical protein